MSGFHDVFGGAIDRDEESVQERILHMRSRLKPVAGLRTVRPRVCATCKHLVFHEDGLAECERPAINGKPIVLDGVELEHWEHVCNRWVEGLAPLLPLKEKESTS